jgi:hypothetical protein
MGARPQAIFSRAHAAHANGVKGANAKSELAMRVDVVEPLGDKMDVHLSTARHSHVVAHLDAHGGLEPGKTYSMGFDPARLHFFEADASGATVVSAAGSLV